MRDAPLAGTRYQRVLRTQQADVREVDGATRVTLPVTDRGDAIGLLELDLPRRPSPLDLADLASAAHALAYVVIAARRHTDVFEWGQRTAPFALAAEIQRRLLPASYTCEAGQSLETGTAGIINAGHPFPLRLRDGRVEEIPLGIEAPFGVLLGKSFDVQPLPLRPGDRIVLLTDGMQERNAVDLDVAAALADTADLHPREVVHALGAAVLKETERDLRDDATMVCLDWYGGPPRGRTTEQGADPGLASAPVSAARPG